MTLRDRLARLLMPGEALLDRLRRRGIARRRASGAPVIDPYLGYATADSLVLRGRALSSVRRTNPAASGAWWSNIWQMISLFLTDEVPGITVRAGTCSTVTDEEGYFTLHIPRAAGDEGWRSVAVAIEGGEPTILDALVPRKVARIGIVSDIDDTILKTGAHSLLRNLLTSFTGNALTRTLHPDAVALIADLHADVNPVFYVSSSPWNLHHFLTRIFERHGLVRGPMFLRDYGLGEAQLVTGTHGSHKGESLDTILDANPDLPFVLIGDTGQHDPQVYLDAVERHPGRIAGCVFRSAGRPDRRDQTALDALRGRGIPVHHADDYLAVHSDPAFAAVLMASRPDDIGGGGDRPRDGDGASIMGGHGPR